MKKKINVVAALIKNKDQYLIAQRPKTGFFKNKWEFPGARIEKSGTEANLLLKEIKDNFNLDITLNKQIAITDYEHALYSINITFIECELISSIEDVNLKTHQKIEWVSKNKLSNYDWVEADLEILKHIK